MRGLENGPPGRGSTAAPGAGSRSARCSPRCGRKPASPSASATARAAPEIPRSWSPIPRDSAWSCEARSLRQSPRTRGSGRCLSFGGRIRDEAVLGEAWRRAREARSWDFTTAAPASSTSPRRGPTATASTRSCASPTGTGTGAPLRSTKRCGVQAAMATSSGVGLLARLSAQLCIPHSFGIPRMGPFSPVRGSLMLLSLRASSYFMHPVQSDSARRG